MYEKSQHPQTDLCNIRTFLLTIKNIKMPTNSTTIHSRVMEIVQIGTKSHEKVRFARWIVMAK